MNDKSCLISQMATSWQRHRLRWRFKKKQVVQTEDARGTGEQRGSPLGYSDVWRGGLSGSHLQMI